MALQFMRNSIRFERVVWFHRGGFASGCFGLTLELTTIESTITTPSKMTILAGKDCASAFRDRSDGPYGIRTSPGIDMLDSILTAQIANDWVVQCAKARALSRLIWQSAIKGADSSRSYNRRSSKKSLHHDKLGGLLSGNVLNSERICDFIAD